MIEFDIEAGICAQGDLTIIATEFDKEGLSEMTPEDGKLIVGHSETGHNHILKANRVKCFMDTNNPFKLFVEVEEGTPLEHLRSHDTHGSIMLPPGQYQINQGREYTPEGYRRVQD